MKAGRERGGALLPLAFSPGQVLVVMANLIQEAAKQGDATTISNLLRDDSTLVDDLDGYSRTALMWACHAGHVTCARVLLNHGASLDLTDWCGDTALHEACSKGHKDLASMLLEQGADPIIRDQWGWTALMAAAGTGRAGIVRELIKHPRVNVNQVDLAGRTALWRACCNGHAECAEVFLLEGVANADMADEEGVTPLRIAQIRQHEDCERVMRWYAETRPVYLIAKARRVTDDCAAITKAPLRRRLSQYSVEATFARLQAAPSYLKARVARGEALPLVNVKVGTRKRSRKELEFRSTLAYIVSEMDLNVYEDLMDFFRYENNIA